jgi:hypothetical protein
MLGLILLYFIGKRFYELAAQHQRHKWGHALGGIAVYYLSLIFSGIIITLALDLIWDYVIPNGKETLFGIANIPIGLGVCWLWYTHLKKTWGKNLFNERDAPLDEVLVNHEHWKKD